MAKKASHGGCRCKRIGPTEHAEMRVLLQAMRHRGPDASGSHSPASWALLGANRLRITDATNTAADTPLCSADGSATVVFNGEIYNHRRLRAELTDYPFRTASDTEVLLGAYRRRGPAGIDRLEGTFAFAIHDAAEDSVWIARDPTGQKTLYLWEDAEHRVFASEMDALVADPHREKSSSRTTSPRAGRRASPSRRRAGGPSPSSRARTLLDAKRPAHHLRAARHPPT